MSLDLWLLRAARALRSADPNDSPRILFNLFKERSDLARAIRGLMAIRSVYRQEPRTLPQAEV